MPRAWFLHEFYLKLCYQLIIAHTTQKKSIEESDELYSRDLCDWQIIYCFDLKIQIKYTKKLYIGKWQLTQIFLMVIGLKGLNIKRFNGVPNISWSNNRNKFQRFNGVPNTSWSNNRNKFQSILFWLYPGTQRPREKELWKYWHKMSQ